MNELDQPLRNLALRNGVVSLQAKEGLEYKWMLHESQSWLSRAKQKQGDDWEWSKTDAPNVSYVFDGLGFRNNKSIKEVSKDPEWWLFDSSCFGLGPGVNSERTVPRMLEKYTDKPVYDMSIYGDRPEFICNNILELAKRWINPPKRVILHLVENPTGTFKLTDTNKILNIDYTGYNMNPSNKDFTFFENFEEQKISEGHHRMYFKTIIKMCEVLNLNLTWLYTGLIGDISPVNYMEDQDVIFHNCPGASVGHYNNDNNFKDRERISKETIIEPMIKCKPAGGVSVDQVGRDLFHPGPESHKVMAQKICQHFLETRRNF